jgi:RHS repeat-associated protein
MGTNKGFTGQYNDTVTGLDYYNARYYDPVVGVFLAADTVQGNPQGVNPYAYVGGNPETKNDPTGHGPFDPPQVIGLLGAAMIVGPPMLGLAIIGVTVIVIFYAPSATDQNYPSNGPQPTPAPTPTETQTPTPTPSTDTNGGCVKLGVAMIWERQRAILILFVIRMVLLKHLPLTP